MGEAVVAALIGAIATVIAAFVTSRANQHRASALAKLNELEKMKVLANAEGDKRTLTSKELDDIKAQRTVKDQLLDTPVTQVNSGEVQVKLVYPGDAKYRNYSIYHERSDESKNYSEICAVLDGQQIGSGSGEQGFSLTFTVPVGRHTLLFTWTGTQNNSRTSSSSGETRYYDADLSGRKELVFWAVGGGHCTVHLDQQFEIDHAEPNLALATCHACRMPGLYRCKCQRKYCGEHADDLGGRLVCSFCKNQAIEAEQRRIKAAEEDRKRRNRILIAFLLVLALISGFAALGFVMVRM